MFAAAILRPLRQACSVASRVRVAQAPRPISVLANNRLMKEKMVETDEEFDQRYVDYLSRPDCDGWEIRKAMTDLNAEDLVPEPAIIIAAMHACRRNNDLALAIRILESIRDKCVPGKMRETIWPYVVQELTPTCKELGVPFPEEIGYDKPELWKEQIQRPL